VSAICIITNCQGRAPSGGPFCAKHRDKATSVEGAGEWRRTCDACEGEGTVERRDIPLHHLHSESPEYAQRQCGECDGAGWRWTDELIDLADAPVGLFWCGDTLAMKTEYGNNEGRIDAFIVSSGEFFWGDAPQTIASQRASMVLPIEPDYAATVLAA